MKMAKAFWDCHPKKCKSVEHGDYIVSCITKEDIQALKYIFKYKCSNAAQILDRFGRNPLHVAVSCGRYEVAEWLINECDVEIHAKDFESGWNALHRSLFYGNIDCAILLLKSGLDFKVQDKDGMNPLKLVCLDAQGSKILQNETKFVRVVLPYHASEQGEISLQIDQIVKVIKECKSTEWGLGRIIGTKEKGKFPLNFVTVLDDEEDGVPTDELNDDDQSDAYLWGNNSNFTLGQADTKNRDFPELVESLHLKKCSIIKVAVSKYHTIFLCKDGTVFSCGQGRGGRLGHGNEQTVLSPKIITALKGIFCTDVSSANDHTLILDQMGQVHSFGLNAYHQLGHNPVPSQCLTPKLIYNKYLKGKVFIGVTAARFHSAIYTNEELFTFGLNAGQLGHLKGDDWQSTPRLVTSLYKKDAIIELVSASDGSTCCALSNGDIFVLQDYTYRRIATRMMNIERLLVKGGELRCKVLSDLQHKDPDELHVVLLKTNGMVLSWKKGYGTFKECYWVGKKKELWQVVDISLGRNLLIVTDEGTVFHGHFHSSKTRYTESRQGKQSLMGQPFSSIVTPITDLFAKTKKRREECEEVMIERVPLLYRAYQVACDVKSKIFAVIQNDPWLEINSSVIVTTGTLNKDLRLLLEESDVTDSIHDVIIKVKNGELPAHRFILVSKIHQDITCQLKFDAMLNKYVLNLENDDIKSVKQWLVDVYIGNTDKMFDSSKVDLKPHRNENDVKHNSCEYRSATFGIKSFALRDIESPDHHGCQGFCDGDGNVHENLPKSHIRKSKKKKENQAIMNGDHKSVQNRAKGKGLKCWMQMKELSDIRIESEDGFQFHCHKCVLIARLGYFKSMLSNPWMETSWDRDNSIKISMPRGILQIILDFAYTDEAYDLLDCQNTDLLSDVILYADQLLIQRLKEICESSLVKQVSLKNALEMLSFACTYNAELLKQVCCEFVSMNLAFYLETRYLESLPPDVLLELSKVYKEIIPNMAYRVITPSTFHIESDLQQAMNEQAVEKGTREENDHTGFYDEIEQSPRDRLENSGKKKRRRRRSGREVSICEEKMNEAEEEDVRKELTYIEEDEDLMKGRAAQPNVGLCMDSSEGKSNDKLSTKASSSTFLPANDVMSASGTSIKSLREIMKEEENLDDRTKLNSGYSNNNEKSKADGMDGIRENISMKRRITKKKSQKQRKEEMNSRKAEGLNRNLPTDELIFEVKTVCPWGKSDATPVKSLKDVINEEKEMENSLVDTQHNKVMNDKSPNLSATSKIDLSNSVSNEVAWGFKNMTVSPPTTAISLSEIMKSQTEEKEGRKKILKKPLQLIQIEEKAIEDLLLHYNAADNPNELITVGRSKDLTATPIWNINDDDDDND